VILSIDTATLGGSVCLTRNGIVLSTRVGDPAVSHSHSLLRDINECLDQGGVPLGSVDLLAVASGPGSFTGLRIGLATVKALAATLRIACVGIPTLHAVARAGGPATSTVALLPAGRGELFVQMVSVSPDGTVTALDEPSHLSPTYVLEKYGSLKSLRWAGPGAHLHRDLLESYARDKEIAFDNQSLSETEEYPGWSLASLEENLSQYVAALALKRLERNELDDPLSLSALYVRPSDAELKCP
jgi:tRNA threonylcarbamoyladenosine biosynthesis protein TsaB